jgi:hypothetical protein
MGGRVYLLAARASLADYRAVPLVTCDGTVASAGESALTAPPMARDRIIHAAARATRRRFGRVLVAWAATVVGFIDMVIRFRCEFRIPLRPKRQAPCQLPWRGGA